MQNFKNIVSTLWLPLSCLCLVMSWSSVPMCLIFFDLCPISDLFLQSEPVCCTWSMWCPCFHVITKILHFPFTPLLLVSPFWLFTIILLYSQNEWKNVIKMIKNCQNLVITHIICISPLMLITPPIIYLPFWIYLPLFDTYVKGFYGVIPCLAKNALFTSRSIFRVASQLFSAMSNDLCWIASSTARSTSPSCVEILGSFFRTISTYICSLWSTSKWGVI